MNRQTADRVLAAACFVFAAAVYLRWLYRDVLWADAFFRVAEAALVGGIADWFAVTALFRKPLGFSFHTSIIPRNRQRIVEAMTYMVQEEFLSRQSIQQQLQKVRLVSLFITWMDQRGGKTAVFSQLERLLSDWAETADRAELARWLAAFLRSRLQAVRLHHYAPAFGGWLFSSGRGEQLFTAVLAGAKTAAWQPGVRQTIHDYLEKSKREAAGDSVWSRLLGSLLTTFDFVNLPEAAAALHERLLAEIDAMDSIDHPLRLWLREKIVESLAELEQNPQWQMTLEEWKSGLLLRIPLEDIVQLLLERLFSPLVTEQEPGQSVNVLSGGVLRFAAGYWETFRTDTALQNWLERHLQEAAAEVVMSEHKLIGELVGQALSTLSDRELNAFIEDKVGEDLAWIRVNGSLVGAAAGLAVFFAGRYLYLPYLWPAIKDLWRWGW